MSMKNRNPKIIHGATKGNINNQEKSNIDKNSISKTKSYYLLLSIEFIFCLYAIYVAIIITIGFLVVESRNFEQLIPLFMPFIVFIVFLYCRVETNKFKYKGFIKLIVPFFSLAFLIFLFVVTKLLFHFCEPFSINILNMSELWLLLFVLLFFVYIIIRIIICTFKGFTLWETIVFTVMCLLTLAVWTLGNDDIFRLIFGVTITLISVKDVGIIANRSKGNVNMTFEASVFDVKVKMLGGTLLIGLGITNFIYHFFSNFIEKLQDLTFFQNIYDIDIIKVIIDTLSTIASFLFLASMYWFINIFAKWRKFYIYDDTSAKEELINSVTEEEAKTILLSETENDGVAVLNIETINYEIRHINAALREKVQPIIDESWSAPFIATNGKLWDSRIMPGFVAVSCEKTYNGKNGRRSEKCTSEDVEHCGEILGYLLYEFHDGACEIMLLESIAQNIGIATVLIENVKQTAKASNIDKIIVQTTNDNTHAIRFYQRRGFTINEVRLGALDIARKLKPSIPLFGADSIPIRDEIEFVFEGLKQLNKI